MANILFMTNVMAVRIAKGVRRLTQPRETETSFLYAWTPGNFADVQVMDTTDWYRDTTDRIDIQPALGKTGKT